MWFGDWGCWGGIAWFHYCFLGILVEGCLLHLSRFFSKALNLITESVVLKALNVITEFVVLLGEIPLGLRRGQLLLLNVSYRIELVRNMCYLLTRRLIVFWPVVFFTFFGPWPDRYDDKCFQDGDQDSRRHERHHFSVCLQITSYAVYAIIVELDILPRQEAKQVPYNIDEPADDVKLT